VRAQVYDGPATVLKALASRRHGPDSMPRVDEGDEQQASDEDVEEISPGPRQPACLGYQMRALAVHTVRRVKHQGGRDQCATRLTTNS
jgi:1-phosphatidylinositol-4-phosphate 5-kinase